MSSSKNMMLFLAFANAAGWTWAWWLFADRPALLGSALLAWLFGLRHGLDGDHIAAIDNAVRKLMDGPRPPVATGFYFAIGHATIVIAASIGVAITAATMSDLMQTLEATGAVVGLAISTAFLLLIGFANMRTLPALWRTIRSSDPLPGPLPTPGPRLIRGFSRMISRPWHLYPLGVLFGLGFETATEVGLLGVAATQAVQGLPAWQIMVFPALFTAAMAFVDTGDSVLMTRAYGWAGPDPRRRAGYIFVMTSLSVVIALLIGGFQAISALVGALGQSAAVIEPINALLARSGIAVVGLFVLLWVGSMLATRVRGLAPTAPR